MTSTVKVFCRVVGGEGDGTGGKGRGDEVTGEGDGRWEWVRGEEGGRGWEIWRGIEESTWST